MFQLRMQAGRGQDGGQSFPPRGCGSARLHWPPAFSTSPSANAARLGAGSGLARGAR